MKERWAMSRSTSDEQVVLSSLRKGYAGRPSIFQEEAYQILMEVTGQDFDYAFDKWRIWLSDHKYPGIAWRKAIQRILRDRKAVLICHQKPPSMPTLNPVPQQVTTAIEQLDGNECYGLSLQNTKAGVLMMWGGNENRIMVVFHGYPGGKYSKFRAELMDSDVADPDRELTIQVGDTEKVKKLCETVPRSVASEVAVYFAEHGRLPKGFHWTQDIKVFT